MPVRNRFVAPIVLPVASLILGLSACTAEVGDPEDRLGTAEEPISGLALGSTPAGLARIVVNGVNVTGAVVDSSKIVTGTASVPLSVGTSVVVYLPGEGGQQRSVDQRWEHGQFGVTMFHLAWPASGNNVLPISTTPPQVLVGMPLSCAGFDSANKPVGVGLTVTQTTLTGYKGTFAPGSSIGNSEDGVPCSELSGGLTGLALSTSGGTHTQVSLGYLAPWIAEPTNKTLTFRRHSTMGGTGTISSTPSGLATCNNIAYGGACTAAYQNGSRIQITAVPDGTSVASWTGCSSVTGNGNVCTVQMNGSKNASVRFTDCYDCFDACYDQCIEQFGSSVSQCTGQCNSQCAACS